MMLRFCMTVQAFLRFPLLTALFPRDRGVTLPMVPRTASQCRSQSFLCFLSVLVSLMEPGCFVSPEQLMALFLGGLRLRLGFVLVFSAFWMRIHLQACASPFSFFLSLSFGFLFSFLFSAFFFLFFVCPSLILWLPRSYQGDASWNFALIRFFFREFIISSLLRCSVVSPMLLALLTCRFHPEMIWCT